MVGSRTATAIAGLLASLAVSVALWWQFDTLLFLLFVPVVPFLFRGGDATTKPSMRRCPRCEFRTRNEGFEYCPRDGSRLEREG